MGIVKEGRGLRCLEVENREREREREREPSQTKKNSPREPDDDRLGLHSVVHHQPRPTRGPKQGLVEPQGAEGGDLGGEDDAEGREGRRRWKHLLVWFSTISFLPKKWFLAQNFESRLRFSRFTPP